APPGPSIFRGSERLAATNTRSRSPSSVGKSSRRKYSPFELPPRISEQRIGVCIAAYFRSPPDAHKAELTRIASAAAPCRAVVGSRVGGPSRDTPEDHP